MSCPDVACHAHAPFTAEMRPEPTTRRLGTVWSLAWVLSFVGHAGIAAVVLLAPLAKRMEAPDATILVELIGGEAADAAPGSGDVRTEPTDVPHQESQDAPQTPEPIPPAEQSIAIKPEPPPAGENAHTETLPQTIAPTAFAIPPPNPTPPPQNIAVEFKVADAMPPLPESSSLIAFPSKTEGGPAATAETAVLPSLIAGSAAKAFGDNRKPSYPAYARRRGIEGRVVLDVIVAANGKAKDVSVAQSSRYEVLDEAAVKAVREWRFHPARENGRTIESHLMVPVTFRLNEGR